MIYVLFDGSHYKIGHGKSPRDRLRTMQTGNSRPLKIVATVTKDDLYEFATDEQCDWPGFERDLHWYLEQYRVLGEWFNGAHPHVRAVVELLSCGRAHDVNALIQLARKFQGSSGTYPMPGRTVESGTR
jgi:hypothetical protein